MLLLRVRIIMGTNKEQLVARLTVLQIYIKYNRTATIYPIPCMIIITSYFTASKNSPFQHEGDWDFFEGWWWGDDKESWLENLMSSMALGIQNGAIYLLFKVAGLMILHKRQYQCIFLYTREAALTIPIVTYSLHTKWDACVRGKIWSCCQLLELEFRYYVI